MHKRVLQGFDADSFKGFKGSRFCAVCALLSSGFSGFGDLGFNKVRLIMSRA